MTHLNFEGKKVIIFDLDGTIVDLAVDWVFLKGLLSDMYTRLYGNICEFNSISACLNCIIDKDDNKELNNFFKIIQEHELKTIDESKVVEEAVFFIKNLNLFGINDEIKLVVFSLNTRKAIEIALKLAGIYEIFDFIVGREDVKRWKPDPEGLFIIQDHYKLKQEEMIYIGDLPKDIQTGKNAGIETHLIDEIIKLVNKKRQEIG